MGSHRDEVPGLNLPIPKQGIVGDQELPHFSDFLQNLVHCTFLKKVKKLMLLTKQEFLHFSEMSIHGLKMLVS